MNWLIIALILILVVCALASIVLTRISLKMTFTSFKDRENGWASWFLFLALYMAFNFCGSLYYLYHAYLLV